MRMKTVFLVEDNQDNADLIRDLIGDLTVSSASRMGLLHCPLTQRDGAIPDLLLLDISLPGMDGTSLLGQIRLHERLKHIPAVAITAHAMKSDKENLLAAGFNAYLSKPITDDQLLLDAIEAHASPLVSAAA